MSIEEISDKKLLLIELKSCFEFFTKETNWKKDSRGYGLVRDMSLFYPNISSISATGFGLATLVSAVENNWISQQGGYNKANGTLDTILNNLINNEGFYFHFVNFNSGEREYNSEISIIDTGILICGAIAAGEFFGKDVLEKANKLYRKINWEWFVDQKQEMFYLGNIPEKGFYGNWDVYAEQLILYILSAGSPTHNIGNTLYNKFNKPRSDYKEYKDIIHSWFGSLFTYQYSHAWIDFRKTKDKNNIDWFENSTKASLANRQYCIDNQINFKTYGNNSWGISAGLSPSGYNVECGAYPASVKPINDGTIVPYGALSSIVFTPNLSIQALRNYYQNIPSLVGEYGLKSSFNLEQEIPWFSQSYLGIDKGITLLMIENYLNGSIWKNMMKNEYIKTGMDKLYIRKKID